jgi:hypothetical protein
VSEILLANSDAGISPQASIAIPHRLSARPITWRGWSYVHGRRWIVVARARDCGSDNGSCGEAAYNAGRHIPAACTHWGDPGSAKGQQESHDEKLLHFGAPYYSYVEEARLLAGGLAGGFCLSMLADRSDPTKP